MDSTTTAGASLAGTPELVEMVLLQLPILDILVFQRVNRTWNEVIKDSPQLQRALFLKPTSRETIDTTGDDTRRVEGCGTAADCVSDSYTMVYSSELDRATACVYGCELVLNPVLTSLNDRVTKSHRGPRWLVLGDEKRTQASAYPNASWRNMLFAQPPVNELITESIDNFHFHKLCASDAETGVTLSDFDKHHAAFPGTLCVTTRSKGAIWFSNPRPDLLDTAEEVLNMFEDKGDGIE